MALAMDKTSRSIISELEDIQDELLEIHSRLVKLTRKDDSYGAWAEAYIVRNLRVLIDKEHGLLCRDPNIQRWAELLGGADDD